MSGHYHTPIWPIPVTAMGVVLAVFGVIVWSSTRSTTTAGAHDLSRWERIELKCDRQVNILMTTKDMVELERARFLLDWFGCLIGRRLEPMPPP